MRHDQIADKEDRYIVGDLPQTEMAEFARHLAGCTECRQRLDDRQAVAAQMFEAIVPVAPPPHLRASILAAAADTAQDAPPARQLPRRVGFVGLRTGRAFTIGLAALAAALLVACAVLFGQVQTLTAQHERYQQELALAASPDTIVWYMMPTDKSVDANRVHATMYARPASDKYLITASRLAQAPGDSEYRLWVERDDKTYYTANIPIDAQGNAYFTYSDPGHASVKIPRCIVTLENRANPPALPTTKPLFEWKEGKGV